VVTNIMDGGAPLQEYCDDCGGIVYHDDTVLVTEDDLVQAQENVFNRWLLEVKQAFSKWRE